MRNKMSRSGHRTTKITRATLLDSWTRAPRSGEPMRPSNKEFLVDLEQVLRGLEVRPGEAIFARGRFVACYLTVSAPAEGTVNATLSLVPHDGRWIRVQGVEIELTAPDGRKHVTRSGLSPGVTFDGLPVGMIRVALGPHSLPRQ